MKADLVLFDAEDVSDVASYDDPQRTPRGIECVVVNGALAYLSGAGAPRGEFRGPISRSGRVLTAGPADPHRS